MKTLDDLIDEGVEDRFVLLRADFNVPLDGYRIADDGRILAALPTITRLAGAGAKVLILAHLGRPDAGSPPGHDPLSTLAPIAGRLRSLVDARVSLADDVVGPSARGVVEGLRPGAWGCWPTCGATPARPARRASATSSPPSSPSS